MTAPRASVIIPNWNGLDHLPECLESLRAQTFRDFEIVVVDNASTDGSVGWLQVNAPDVRVFPRTDNGGFSAAVNDGIRVAAGDVLVLLNNDTAAERDWLLGLVSALDDTGYDFAASCMVFYEQPDVVNAAGDVFRMHLGSPTGDQLGRLEPRSEHLEQRRTLGACAGAAAYRRSFFEDVGLFDEVFFLLHEDTDINLRGLIAGKRCVYVPEAVVLHKDSASIRQHPGEWMWRLSIRNQWLVIGKDMPGVLIPYFAVSFLWSNVRMVLPARPSNWHRIPGLLRQWPALTRSQLEGIRMGWGRRSDVWRRQQTPTREIIRWLFHGSGPIS